MTTATSKTGAGKFIVRAFLVLIGLGVAFFLLLQLIPVNRSNPPMVSEPNWDSPATRDLAKRACFDCHSNETTWPWYSYVAPASWLIAHDVEEGRQRLNFSDWANVRGEARHSGELAESILEGKMPPASYLPTHPQAVLTNTEKQALVDGLRASLAQTDPGGAPVVDNGEENDD